MSALFYAPARDAIVSTTVDGVSVTFKVSEHRVGKAIDASGKEVDVSGVPGVTSEPIAAPTRATKTAPTQE